MGDVAFLKLVAVVGFARHVTCSAKCSFPLREFLSDGVGELKVEGFGQMEDTARCLRLPVCLDRDLFEHYLACDLRMDNAMVSVFFRARKKDVWGLRGSFTE